MYLSTFLFLLFADVAKKDEAPLSVAAKEERELERKKAEKVCVYLCVSICSYLLSIVHIVIHCHYLLVFVQYFVHIC